MITIKVPKIGIPDIGEEKLNERLKRIEPIMEFGGVKSYVKWSDPRKTSYIWDAKSAGKADPMTLIAHIRTYHSYGAPSLFKPSVAEVLSQIPDEIAAKVIAFEIVKQPQTADDLNHENKALNAGYHVATVALYGKPGEAEIHDIQATDRCAAVS